jgi:hypothetical protein
VLALLAQAPDGFPGGGPDTLEQLLDAYYLLFAGGFVIAVLGHLLQSRTLVLSGIILVFLGTAVFLIAVGTHG